MKNSEILICDCHSTEHQIVVHFDNDDRHPEVYMHIYLNKKSFWERLVHGIKYIFGYQCRFGAFEEFIFNPDDADRLQDVVNHLKKDKK